MLGDLALFFCFTLAPATTDMSSSMISTDELALVPVVQIHEARR